MPSQARLSRQRVRTPPSFRVEGGGSFRNDSLGTKGTWLPVQEQERADSSLTNLIKKRMLLDQGYEGNSPKGFLFCIATCFPNKIGGAGTCETRKVWKQKGLLSLKAMNARKELYLLTKRGFDYPKNRYEFTTEKFPYEMNCSP